MYANDKNVKWVIAKRSIEGTWIIRFVSVLKGCPSLEKILDETTLGDLGYSKIALIGQNIALVDITVAAMYPYFLTQHYRG